MSNRNLLISTFITRNNRQIRFFLAITKGCLGVKYYNVKKAFKDRIVAGITLKIKSNGCLKLHIQN